MKNVLDALSVLEADARVKERMVRWITESRSLGIDLPSLTIDHVHLFEPLGGFGGGDCGMARAARRP